MAVRKPIPNETTTAVIATAQASAVPLTAIIGGAVGAYCAFKAMQFSYHLYQIHKKNYQLEGEIKSGKKYLNFSIEKDSANRFSNGFANILVKENKGSLFIFRESKFYPLTKARFAPKFIKNFINNNAYQLVGVVESSDEEGKLKITQIISEKESGFKAFRSALSKFANFIPLMPRTSHLTSCSQDFNLDNWQSKFITKNLSEGSKISWWQKLKAVFSPLTNDENELLLKKFCCDRVKNVKSFYAVSQHRRLNNSQQILQQQDFNNAHSNQQSIEIINFDEGEKINNQSIDSRIKSQMQNISMMSQRNIQKRKIANENNSFSSGNKSDRNAVLNFLNNFNDNQENDEWNFDNQNVDERNGNKPGNIIKELNVSIISKNKQEKRSDSFSF